MLNSVSLDGCSQRSDTKNQSKLSLGSIPFNREINRWRDYYFEIAQSGLFDCIYIGETVCAKRSVTYYDALDEVLEKISSSGIQPVISTLALVSDKKDPEFVNKTIEKYALKYMIEANDMTAVSILSKIENPKQNSNIPFVSGMLMNVYNEPTIDFLVKKGAVRFCFPPEIALENMQILAGHSKSKNLETEMLVYGNLPLSLSSRCFHARHYGLTKDSCRFACSRDPEGLKITTLDGDDFLIVSGVQTLSYQCRDYSCSDDKMSFISNMGIDYFRLIPHSENADDIIEVAKKYRALISEYTVK